MTDSSMTKRINTCVKRSRLHGFWKAWRKRFCVKLLPTNTLNGKTGIDNVLFEFSEYYRDVAKPHNVDSGRS